MCVCIALVGRVFTNDPEDWGLIQVRVIPKTEKWYLITAGFTFSTIRCL